MDGKCIYHPGRNATIEYNNKKYCGKCEQAQMNASKVVSIHVDPKGARVRAGVTSCFVI